jgi:hypothetical protein
MPERSTKISWVSPSLEYKNRLPCFMWKVARLECSPSQLAFWCGRCRKRLLCAALKGARWIGLSGRSAMSSKAVARAELVPAREATAADNFMMLGCIVLQVDAHIQSIPIRW